VGCSGAPEWFREEQADGVCNPERHSASVSDFYYTYPSAAGNRDHPPLGAFWVFVSIKEENPDPTSANTLYRTANVIPHCSTP
jgi:hypothetical protein